MPGDALRKELEVDCVLFDGGNIRGSDGNFENVEICAGRISRNLGEEKIERKQVFFMRWVPFIQISQADKTMFFCVFFLFSIQHPL